MTYRAAIFDLDGTLVNSLGDIGAAMNRALSEHGLAEHPLEAYVRFVGSGVRVLAERAAPSGADVDTLVAAFRRHYERSLVERTRPYPGVVELLDRLAARSLPLAVLTNKYEAAATQVVEALLGAVPFAQVRGQRPGVPKKPDPEPARAIAEALGIEPARCLLVGDTGIDMATARAAGMTGVGVLWGFREEAELREAGARHLLSHPAELLTLVTQP